MDAFIGKVLRVQTSLKTRWAAAAAALVMMPICIGITVLDLIAPVVLIIGAIIAGVWPLAGRSLMWIGLVLLSILVFPFCIGLVVHTHGLVSLSDVTQIAIIYGSAASLILLPLCVVLLLLEQMKGRRMQTR